MNAERPALQVDGHAIVEGTSLFDTRACEVYWVDSIGDGQVTLEGLYGELEFTVSEFSLNIASGELIVERTGPQVPR